MRKVLIITYYWPPSGGSGVQRWLKFAKYLPQYGWEPVIYTPLNPEANATDAQLLQEVSPSITVLKRKIVEPYGLYKRLTGKKSGGTIKANIIAEKPKSLMQRLSIFIRGNLFIPDPRFLWIRPSARFLIKYLKTHPVDAIISTGPPHSMHLIAKRVSRATGIRWIADFRDPWTKIFYFKHLHLSRYAESKHENLEQKVLDSCNRVVVVSPQMQRDFRRMTSTRVELVTNGFDESDFNLPGAKLEEGYFYIVHTGLFPENANPNLLWEAIGEKAAAESNFASKLRILLAGSTDSSVLESISMCGLKGNLTDYGYVEHSQAIALQKSASLLLLTLRKEPEAAAIITGKFFEYLASGREILAVGPPEGDLGKMLIEANAGSISDFCNKEGLRASIEKAFATWSRQQEQKQKQEQKQCGNEATQSAEEHTLPESIMKYSRRNLTAEYVRILENIRILDD